MTVGEAMQLYLELQLAGRPSLRTIRQASRQHVSCWFNRQIASLTRLELLQWRAAMKDTPTHANTAIKALKCAVAFVVREGLYAGANTVVFLKRYTRPSRSRFCQPHEAPAVMRAILQAPPKVKAFILLVGCTSSRPGEVCRMRWADLGVWPINGRDMFVWKKGKTKNGSDDYKPIPHQVWECLVELPALSEWVFPGKNPAQPWAASSYRKAWAKVRLFAGVPDLWVYDLRRTVASWLSIHGENLQTVQHVLNHSSLQSTAVYARLNLQTVAGALQRHTDRLFECGERKSHVPLNTPPVPGGPHPVPRVQ
jgi:integrase